MSWENQSRNDLATWQAMQRAAVQFIHSLGHGVSSSMPGVDGGLGLIGPEVAGQVSARPGPVGRPELQRLCGAAYSRRYALFFSGSGYTPDAMSFAAESGIALFVIHHGGRVEPANDLALAFRNASPASISAVTYAPPKQTTGGCMRVGWAIGWFYLLALGGPITFALAVEARRRSGDSHLSGPGPTSAGRWRFWAMVIGALGIVGWVGQLSRGVIWLVTFDSVSDATSESIGSSLGMIIGLPLVAVLYWYFWSKPHEKLSLPRRFVDQDAILPPPPSSPHPAVQPELGPPWCEFVREAMVATARIAAARATAAGVASAAIERADTEASASLVTVSRVAENASDLDEARRSLDVEKVRERLEHLDTRFGASDDLDEARRALREQIAAEGRMAQVTTRLEGQLHRMVAQLGEAAVRCDELSLRPPDQDVGAGDVATAVDALTALRRALDDVEGGINR